MAQQIDSNGALSSSFGASPTQAPLTPPDRTPDPVAIFSAPDVVFHWWVESKRRWEEQNRTNTLTVRPLVVQGAGYALSGDSK
jgi:hypothetical protein